MIPVQIKGNTIVLLGATPNIDGIRKATVTINDVKDSICFLRIKPLWVGFLFTDNRMMGRGPLFQEANRLERFF